jgi:hypothetical protein
MFKILFTLVILVSFLNISSIGNSECTNQPDEIVKRYFRELSNANFETAFIYIVEYDKKHVKINNKKNNIYKETISTLYKLSTWQIIRSTLNGANAEVVIKLKTPNIGRELGLNIGKHIGEMNYDLLNSEDIWQEVLNNLKMNKFEYIEIIQDMDLICDNSKWKINLNLDKEKKLMKIIKSAVKLHNEREYEEAIFKLKQVLNIDKNNKLAIYLLEKWVREQKINE